MAAHMAARDSATPDASIARVLDTIAETDDDDRLVAALAGVDAQGMADGGGTRANGFGNSVSNF